MDDLTGMTSRIEIERFLSLAYESIETQVELAHVGNGEREIAAFARARGFHFSAKDLGDYIAAQLEARLGEEQKRARAAALARQPKPLAPGGMEGGARVSVRPASTLPLPRDGLFAGDIVVVAGDGAFAALAAHVRRALEEAFGASPAEALAGLEEGACHERVRGVDAALAQDAQVPALVADLVRSLGWPADGAGYFGPFVRYNLPAGAAGAGGYFSQVPVRFTSRQGGVRGQPALLNGHRDTWFGAPFHQLNLWAALYRYPRGSGLVFMPSLFGRALRNNTRGFDVWRAQLGYAVGPMNLDSLESVESVEPALEVGDFVAFSANHFHGTGENPGPVSRISMELRIVCDEDRREGRSAANVDFHGLGELCGFRRIGG